MYGLQLRWPKCDDGAELVDYGEADFNRKPVSREEFDKKIESLEFEGHKHLGLERIEAIIEQIYETETWRRPYLDAHVHKLLEASGFVTPDEKLQAFGVFGAVRSRLAQGGLWIRYASARLSATRFDLSSLEDPLVIRYVNARSDKALVQFCSRFGIPSWGQQKEQAVSKIVTSQTNLENLLAVVGGADRKEAVEAANRGMAVFASRGLTPRLDRFGPQASLRLALTPDSPLVFMTMECAMIAQLDARLARCLHCRNVFLTGPMTGRRSSARFCSDRCRVAASRARLASNS